MSKYQYAKFMLYGAYLLFAWLVVDVVLVLWVSTSFATFLSSMVFLSFIFLLWFAYAYLVYDVAKSVLDTGYATHWKIVLVTVLCMVSMVLVKRDPVSILSIFIDGLILFGAVGILFDGAKSEE
ncbi:MAG: hypothetical protein GXO59_06850 [Dictyoglomi bacterium]|nr:hypothetical protein [Dictyoglomota bacterium]